MPRLFCCYCSNLLVPKIHDDELIFECLTCHEFYASTDEDSLRFEETKEQNIMIYSKLLNKAVNDPANPKVHKKCPKCGYHIAKLIRLGSDMKIILTCYNSKCRNQWFDS